MMMEEAEKKQTAHTTHAKQKYINREKSRISNEKMTDQIIVVSKHEHSRFFFLLQSLLMLMFESTMRIKASVRIQFNGIICNRAISALFNFIRVFVWEKKTDFASYMGLSCFLLLFFFHLFVYKSVNAVNTRSFHVVFNCQKSIFAIQSTTGFLFLLIIWDYCFSVNSNLKSEIQSWHPSDSVLIIDTIKKNCFVFNLFSVLWSD